MHSRHTFAGSRAAASFVLVFLLSLVRPAAAAAARPEKPPNIILILADDLGGMDLGCYGADLHETPQLDRLAAQGMKFTRAYAAAPVCSPTRAALLTGQHPARLQLTTWRESSQNPPRDRALLPPACRADLPRGLRTLAENLKSAGYLTAHVGKWHLGDASHFPETQGFDVHRGGNHWGAPASYFYPYRGTFDDELRYVPGLEWGKEGDYLTDRLTDEAIAVVERAKGRPFFLNLWHYAPHTPMQAKPADVEHFQRKLRPEHQHQGAVYAAMVRNLDENVGRLLRRVEALGLGRDTVVVFTSDNGGYLGKPGLTVTTNAPYRSGKGSLYEGGLRIPLLFRWPGTITAGTRCEVPVTSMDLFATLMDLAKVPRDLDPVQVIDGTSLVPLLANPQATFERGPMFWHFPHYYSTTTPVSAMMVGDWKLLEYHEDRHLELYNLARDPAEANNLALTLPEKADELRILLERWRVEVRAQMPVPRR